MTALIVLTALAGTINAAELAIVRTRRFHQEVLAERLAAADDALDLVHIGFRLRRLAKSPKHANAALVGRAA